MKRALSWGCGVQSTTLAVMSALGDLEPLDIIVTADLGWERLATIRAREWYANWLEDRAFRVEVLTVGDIRATAANAHIHMPFWTSDGGPLQRQCSVEFKIKPVRRFLRAELGFDPSRPPAPPPGSIEQWIGVSWDEWRRLQPSRVQYIRNRHPLIERRMARNDCIDYLGAHGLPVPVKSACVGCPYRSASEWLELQRDSPTEFAEAVAFDETNRHNPLAARTGSTADELYVYKGGVPLAEADLEADAARERRGKQLPLFLREEAL